MPNIRTSFVYPPIPDRSCDWCATTDDYDASWEGEETGWVSSSPIGWGRTEAEAIADLKEQLEDA